MGVRYFQVLLWVVLFCVPVVAGAQTGDALFSQSFTDSTVKSANQSASIADDFVPEISGEIKHVVLWMLYDAEQPATVFIKITRDNGDFNPNNTTLITYSVSPATHEDTGYDAGRYDIIKTTCVLETAAEVSPANSYWLEVGIPSGSYWCSQQPLVFGSTIWAFKEGRYKSMLEILGKEYDAYFDLHMPLALESSSWGSIKASF